MRISYWSADVCSSDLWKLFVDAVKPGWAGPELATLAQRAAQIDTVYGKLAETFLERTTQEWLDLLRELGIPAAPLRTTDELFDNPHLNAVGFFETVDTADGPVRFPGIPPWFSQASGTGTGRAVVREKVCKTVLISGSAEPFKK